MKRSHKPLPVVDIISYGEYTRWDRDSKELPDLVQLSESVKAEVDVEFGMIVEIIKGRGWYLKFEIDHPPFTAENGTIEPPFTGEYQIRSNPHRFFLGDTIWPPVDDKRGLWTMRIFIEDELVAEKSISLI